MSDLHIADGTEKDDFSQSFEQDMKFRDKLDLIKSKVNKIVGVGDIFELWQTSHQKIKNAHFIIWKWINDNVYLLKGNHDYSTFAPQTMKFETSSGLKVLVSHGYQNNKHMTGAHTIALIWIVGKLEKWFPWLDNPDKHPKLYKLLPKKYRKIFEKKFSRIDGIEKDVHEYVKSFAGKYSIVICGHSHIQGSRSFKVGDHSILMLNCGHCTNKAFQGILFDTDTEEWEFV
jgi:predicted phosphodiesterase